MRRGRGIGTAFANGGAALARLDPRGRGGRALRRVMRRPVHHLVAVAFAVLLGVVAINAAFLQPGPHPAPLFTAGEPAARDVGEAAAASGAGDDAPVRRVGPASDDIASVLARAPATLDAPAARDPAAGDAAGARATETTAPEGSDLVADLQAELAEKGLYRGARDGVLGSGTIEAIEAFQRSRGLAVTGEPTMDLLVALATDAPAERPKVETVARVQAALDAAGYGPLAVDGIMGRMTADAIRRFERANGLPETGTVSARLEAALGLEPGA